MASRKMYGERIARIEVKIPPSRGGRLEMATNARIISTHLRRVLTPHSLLAVWWPRMAGAD